MGLTHSFLPAKWLAWDKEPHWFDGQNQQHSLRLDDGFIDNFYQDGANYSGSGENGKGIGLMG
ncbi:MAG: hypothetical protein KDE56_01295 [Anaerolineales bacterium]|nr:hypothetical protein [Anaerolineales bacterium]